MIIGSQWPQVILKNPKGVLRDLMGSLLTSRIPDESERGVLSNLKKFHGYLKGFQG